ncbi:hypothetical protein ABT324_11935 [Saccharopolyspora sp. NPDC000359]|uniref:hypothetical protein n=1 Tax=Saccharopolyspora sp. NPDC000359 TaxID=3154251 RepID=UPI00331EC913
MFDQRHPEPPWKRGDDRLITPPRPVWVNLAALFPAPEQLNPCSTGWDLQAEVPGKQTAWRRTALGDWVASVTFTVHRGDGTSGGVPLSMWVPPGAIRLRHDAPARKDQEGPAPEF